MLKLVVVRSPNIDVAAAFYNELGLNLEKHSHPPSNIEPWRCI